MSMQLKLKTIMLVMKRKAAKPRFQSVNVWAATFDLPVKVIVVMD